MKKKYLIANWKMNFTLNQCKQYIDEWNEMDVSDEKVMNIIFRTLWLKNSQRVKISLL